MDDFEPQTDTEAFLFRRLRECERERDDAERAIAIVRGALAAYESDYAEHLDARARVAELPPRRGL